MCGIGSDNSKYSDNYVFDDYMNYQMGSTGGSGGGGCSFGGGGCGCFIWMIIAGVVTAIITNAG